MSAGVDAAAGRDPAIDAAGWGEPIPLYQPHNPAFWLYIGVVVLGAVHLATEVANIGPQYTAAMVSSAFIWALYCLPWVWFLHHKDRFGRETRRLAVVGFLWGGFAATWVMALPGNAAMLSIFSKLFDADTANSIGPMITAPLVEESAKGVGVVMLVLLAGRVVRTSYDGFILGAYVGLGFQVFEDWLYGVNASTSAFGFNQVQSSFATFASRGSFSGLVSHTLYTALVGAGIGAWVQSRGEPLGSRLPRVIGPIAAALVAHGIWDLAAFGGYKAIVIVTGIFAVVMVLVVGRSTRGQLRPWMAELLAPEVEAGLVSDEQLSVMVGSVRDRRRYVSSVKDSAGNQAGKAARYVLDAQLDLADALGHSRGTNSEDVEQARSELVRLQGLLADATATPANA